ncbi:MAG TPA: hypothetical protein VGQ38_01345 [Gaiellaceae bacterium]|nr:hypothetical protein [Gaiellaceae bacterium]
MDDYEYELRRDGAVIATGRLQLEQRPSPGDVFTLGRRRVRVDDVMLLAGTPRLILETEAA